MFPAIEHLYACVRSNFDSAARTSVGLLTSSFASGLWPSFLGCGPISIAVFLSCLESTCATNFSFSTCGQAHQTACADFVFSLLAFDFPQGAPSVVPVLSFCCRIRSAASIFVFHLCAPISVAVFHRTAP
jgi:hypothetical protein